MVLSGNARCFGDNITTDYLTPGRYKYQAMTMEDYVVHMLEDIRPGFGASITSGDILTAGKNFGCGSSRETAASVIKASGISCVLAKSFSRIFYRNAISIGLLVMECDTGPIREGERLCVDPAAGTVTLENGTVLHGTALPEQMLQILLDGGMAQVFAKHHAFRI